MRGEVFIAVGLLAGCIRPDLVECGDLACAPSQVCHANRCLDPAQLAPCAPPVSDGAECTALETPGHCAAGVCEAATCGDGFLDVSLREECDVGVPSAEHCVDLGYELGRPGCTECQTDSSIGCTRFGWERLRDAATTQLWTDGTTFAFLTASQLEVHGPGVDVVTPGVFTGIHGGGGTIAAWNAETMVAVTGSASTAVTLPAGITTIDHARVGDDGRIYLLSGCTVRVRTGAQWTTLANTISTPPCPRVEVGPTATPRVFVVADNGNGSGVFPEIYELNRTTNRWVVVADPLFQVANIRYQATGDALWILGTSGALRRETATSRQNLDVGHGASTIAFTGDVAWIGDTSGHVTRYREGELWQLRTPGLVTTDGTQVYSYRGPISRFRGIDYGDRSTLPATAQPVSAILEEPTRFVVLTRANFYVPHPTQDNWTGVAGATTTMRAIAGASPNYVVSSFTDTPGSRQASLLESTTGFTGWAAVVIPMNPVVYGLWRAADATLIAVGDDDAGTAVFGVRRGAQWTMQTIAGCTARAVDGSDATHVVAVGACADRAVIWSFDGTAWAEVARPDLDGPLAAVDRLADGSIVAVGMGGAARFAGGAWLTDRDAIGESISATAPDDIWIAGPFTSVQHFDGTAWSRLAITASSPIAVLAHPDRVVFPGATEGFVELVR